MFSSCSLGMDQVMTWILKLIRYWLNLGQVHQRLDSKSLTNFSEAYAPVCNVWRFSFPESNVLHFHSSTSDRISWTHCSSIHRQCLILSLRLRLLLMTFIWFSKKCFIVLMLFVFLTWICRPSSFFSNLFTLPSTLNLYSKGKEVKRIMHFQSIN